MRFRKMPVEVQASHWFGQGDHLQVIPFISRPGVELGCCRRAASTHGWVATLEGGHTVCPGDWIIEGTKGEFYPVKPEIFSEIYEEVLEEEKDSGAEGKVSYEMNGRNISEMRTFPGSLMSPITSL